MNLKKRLAQLATDERVHAEQIICAARELLVAIESSDPDMRPSTRAALDYVTFGVMRAIERERT